MYTRYLLILVLAAGAFAQAPASSLELRVSENGRYFLRGGRPFFWMGDTVWSIVNRYTPEEAAFYMEQRRKQGFNVLNVMLIFNGGPGINTAVTDTQAELPFVDMNPATPNDRYFRNVDRIVAIARENGFTLAVAGCGGSSGSFVTKQKVITAANARAYGRWLGRRYKNDPNIIWVNGFDLPPWQHEEIAREFAAGLQEGDGGAHLITYHPAGGGTSAYFHYEPWLAANTIQTWANYPSIYPTVYADYLRVPTKPVIMAEGAYEEGPEYPTRPITPLVVRQQAYWSYLAGAYHTYGHNDMWRKNPTWRESLQSPGARQMTILKNVLSARQWWRYAPDQSVFALGAGGGKIQNAAARSSDGDGIVVYLSNPATVSLRMDRITAGAQVKARWINPETGEETPVGVFPNRGVQVFSTPPGRSDALLLLDAVKAQ